ncbi:MAG: FISUMP domain-containing protein [Bacteroidota bacterium]
MKLSILSILLLGLFSISPPQEDYVKDIDGNKYPVFEHNGYLIMAENLRTTRFRDGTKIKKTAGYEKWKQGLQTRKPMYCFFQNMKEFTDEGGYLYSPAAVRSDLGLAPEGWHIPTYEEWQEIFFKGDQTEVHNVYSLTYEILRNDRKRAKKYKNELHISRKFAALGSGYRKNNGTFSPSKYFSATHLATADGKGCFELDLMGRGTRGTGSMGSHLRRSLPSPDAGIAVRCVRKL